jgi:hypothetical protein
MRVRAPRTAMRRKSVGEHPKGGKSLEMEMVQTHSHQHYSNRPPMLLLISMTMNPNHLLCRDRCWWGILIRHQGFCTRASLASLQQGRLILPRNELCLRSCRMIKGRHHVVVPCNHFLFLPHTMLFQLASARTFKSVSVLSSSLCN